MLGINAASTALQISSAAYNGPLAALRVARTARGDFHVNPTQEELREASLNLIVAMRKHEKTVMIELDGRESSAEHLEHALDVAFRHVAKLHEAMEQLTAEPKDELASEDFSGLERLLEETARERIYYVITDAGHDKISRDMEIKAIFEEICAEKGEKIAKFWPKKCQMWSKIPFFRVFELKFTVFDKKIHLKPTKNA